MPEDRAEAAERFIRHLERHAGYEFPYEMRKRVRDEINPDYLAGPLSADVTCKFCGRQVNTL